MLCGNLTVAAGVYPKTFSPPEATSNDYTDTEALSCALYYLPLAPFSLNVRPDRATEARTLE